MKQVTSKRRNKRLTRKKIRNGKVNLDWTPSNKLHSTIKRMLKAS